MTIVSMFIIDKAGRKKLLIIGNFGMAIFAFLFATFSTLGVINLLLKFFNQKFKFNFKSLKMMITKFIITWLLYRLCCT